ncbi:MAG: radical SAM family heme chaperone HemW [Anaerolineales bacterium]
MSLPYSIYLHIPFCRHRCAYCDFNTYAGQEALIPAYVEALIAEIESLQSPHLTVHTVFFGGGTPSLLAARDVGQILEAVARAFNLSSEAEITLEANPGTVSPDSLRALRAAGVNRLSFGMQSANPSELRLLEREHSFVDVIHAVTWARRAGFLNLNLDLIYGLPQQSLDLWQRSLEWALRLRPEHLSLYALTIEHGTPFGRWVGRGLMPAPEDDRAAEMLEWACERLERAGYAHYEISNWALDLPPSPEFEAPRYACRHNLQYWRAWPYLGLGAGAHGYAAGYRYSNVLRIRTYIERLQTGRKREFPFSPAVVQVHRQTPEDEMGEFMMLNLRLTRQGVSLEEFRQRFGRDVEEIYGEKIRALEQAGLLEVLEREKRLRLTARGRLLGNRVFREFV